MKLFLSTKQMAKKCIDDIYYAYLVFVIQLWPLFKKNKIFFHKKVLTYMDNCIILSIIANLL